MAICDEVPALKVTVKVAGKTAAEYDDADGSQMDGNNKKSLHRVFKYIESQDHALFSIKCLVDDSYPFESKDHELSCSVFVDGQYIDNRMIGKLYNSFEFKGTLTKGPRDDICGLQLLKFGCISTVDNAERARVEKDSKAARAVGLIQVQVSRLVVTGGRPEYNIFSNTVSNTPNELAEKALKGKAIFHGLSYYVPGGTVPSPPLWHTEELDGGRPLVTFNFKYRSREALRQEMVIRRTPIPDDAMQEMANLTQNEIWSLALEQVRSLKESSAATLNGIKTERQPVSKREIQQVYDLTGPNPVGGAKRQKPETIDLTEDDD